ncbi:MAG TPA: translation initiation factor IF-3 [Myxococcota bacterium]|nr:translation initiation factor IF-3 [Myxococcota bacterium]HRY94028.1 translation initiation factor IF-3 [Myxococcota bacterium]
MPGTNNRVNRQIRAREVRVISGDGEQLGIMSIEEALRKADEQGLDLVEVAAVSRPPVCRIMDYGKFKYSQKKKQKGTRQASQQMKEVKLRPKTEEHDYQVKLKHITRFLTEGHKVKITVRFRGREMAHKDIGLEMLNRISKDAGDLAVIAAPPLMEGRLLQMVLAPSPRALVIKRAKDEERAKLREQQALARKARADRGEPPLEEKEEEPEEEEEDLDEDDDDEEDDEEDDKEGAKE